ncbi:hypothetical protein ACFQ0B_45280 [Nonomuraea thailandensis]
MFAFTEQTTGVGFDADQLLAENAPVIVLDVPRDRRVRAAARAHGDAQVVGRPHALSSPDAAG